VRRRDLLAAIGAVAGSGAAYQAMTAMGFAAESPWREPVKLEGAPKGASVIVLGAGVAGMVAAFELRQAGYTVSLLEYNTRPGGRNWTLRGGDRYTELGGATQLCGFDTGHYLNPGPWRIPYHHHAILAYCRRFGVALEPFTQLNHNAYFHSARRFDGKPQRVRAVLGDFRGHVAELLAKSTKQGALDQAVTAEDRAILLEAMRGWGALDQDFAYRIGEASANVRGWIKDPGGGIDAAGVPGEPLALSDLLQSGVWGAFAIFSAYDFQTTLFQPVGGMDMIGKAFARQLEGLIRYESKVTRIQQSDKGVTVTWEDAAKPGHRGLVRVHHPASDPFGDSGRCGAEDEGGDRCRSLCRVRQDRLAVPAAFLGGGRGDLRWHLLHRPADQHDQLPSARHESGWQGRSARGLYLG
jgi:monoamine oxidase